MSDTKLCPYCSEEIKASAIKCKHCGSMLGNTNADSGTTIIDAFNSQFEILEEVGRGGMAVVYKARQKSLDRIIALKIIPKEFSHDKEFTARFKKESRDGATLNHPNIITIYDSGEIAGYPYMSMEYLEGDTLSNRIREKGDVFSETEIKKVLIPILDGLGYAHEKGIIHRDIKSSNIMFDAKGRPVLMDFGIAKSMDGTRLTKTGTYMGTPEYSSPEQADSKENIDHRTDIYSIGVVAYEMATGTVPFRGDNPISVLHHVIHKDAADPSTLNAALSTGISNVIMRSIMKDAQERYQDCEDFKHGLVLGYVEISTKAIDNKELTKTELIRTQHEIHSQVSDEEINKSNKKKLFIYSKLSNLRLYILGSILIFDIVIIAGGFVVKFEQALYIVFGLYKGVVILIMIVITIIGGIKKLISKSDKNKLNSAQKLINIGLNGAMIMTVSISFWIIIFLLFYY